MIAPSIDCPSRGSIYRLSDCTFPVLLTRASAPHWPVSLPLHSHSEQWFFRLQEFALTNQFDHGYDCFVHKICINLSFAKNGLLLLLLTASLRMMPLPPVTISFSSIKKCPTAVSQTGNILGSPTMISNGHEKESLFPMATPLKLEQLFTLAVSYFWLFICICKFETILNFH